MFSLRGFWKRHRNKIFITVGVLGSGYVLCELYYAYKRSLADLEKKLADEQMNEDLIKAQTQAQFENIQRISETMTLPHEIHYLSTRISEELNLWELTDKLMKGKDRHNAITFSEKLALWERLKILGFTKMLVALWAVILLSLYIKVQVNILGRHLYLDTARNLRSSFLIEDVDLVDRADQQNFLASTDYFTSSGIRSLIINVKAAVEQVFKGTQLSEIFNARRLRGTIMDVLDGLLVAESPNPWVDYLVNEDVRSHRPSIDQTTGEFEPFVVGASKFDQLMEEARAVLSSGEFSGVVEMSMKTATDALMEDMAAQSSGVSSASGMPLAKLLPLVVHTGLSLLNEPGQQRFIHIVTNLPAVQLFFSLLFADHQPSFPC